MKRACGRPNDQDATDVLGFNQASKVVKYIQGYFAEKRVTSRNAVPSCGSNHAPCLISRSDRLLKTVSQHDALLWSHAGWTGRAEV